MKAKIIQIKKPLFFSFILFFLFLGSIFTICMDQIDSVSFETKQVSSKVRTKQENTIVEQKVIEDNIAMNLVEYENFPREYRGYKVVGKIKIPKLEIEKYILEETTEQSLKASSCLSQETNGEREVTLITCTLGAIKRNIVKAIEVYD